MIITGDAVARFVSERIGKAISPPFTAMGIERDGAIVGGAVFSQFEHPDIHVSLGGTGWTRGFIKAVGQYVFGQLGCERMTVTTEQPKVADYALRLGGEVEGRLRNHFGRGRDGLIVGILKDDWRFAIRA